MEEKHDALRDEVKILIYKHGGLEPVVRMLMETITNENRNNVSIRLEAARILGEFLNYAR